MIGGLVIARLLFGCGLEPLGNDPPRLVSFNGVPYGALDGFQGAYDDPRFQVTAGEDYPIAFEVADPERTSVRVWFPWSPEGWDVDPDGTSGVWTDPETPTWGVTMILEDASEHDPQKVAIEIPIVLPGDTGF